MIVFLLSGFWHGASWSFVFWGMLHGFFVVITRYFKRFFTKVHPILNWLITFTFVNVAWVFFRAETFSQALMLLGKAVSFRFEGVDPALIELVRSPELTELLSIFSLETLFPPFVLTAYLVISFLIVLGRKNANEKMQTFRPTAWNLMTTLFLMVWSIFSLTGISTFLYFNF